jgi:hypothetical protein
MVWVALFVAGLAAVSPAGIDVRSAGGVRLIMVEEAGCRFCRAWDAEIGTGYRKSAEGRFAPLKRLARSAPELKAFAPVVYTPTFLVVRANEELGRITGYPGADYFYDELRAILAVAGFFPGP